MRLRTCATPQSGGWRSVSTWEATTRRKPTSSAHQKRNHSASSVLICPRTSSRCDDSVRELRQNGTIGFKSRGTAQHSTVLRRKSMWPLSAVTCAPFTNALLQFGRRLHRKSVEADRICLCLQSPPGARERTAQVLLLITWNCCTLAHGATSQFTSTSDVTHGSSN